MGMIEKWIGTTNGMKSKERTGEIAFRTTTYRRKEEEKQRTSQTKLQPSAITIYHGLYVDGIEFHKTFGKSTLVGARGGTAKRIDFAKDEYITEITFNTGHYTDRMSFQTNRHTYGPFGKSRGGP
eukprot:UN08772